MKIESEPRSHKADGINLTVQYLPLVSIITPVLNGIKYIEPCIESVLHQRYPNVEHVFIDGGSTDGTVDMLSKYSASYPGRVRFLSEPDKGPGDAADKGVLTSKGEIIAYLGYDDLSDPGAIEKAVDFFRANPEVYLVYGDCNFIDDKGELIRRVKQDDFNYKRLLNDTMDIWFTSTYIKREVFDKVGLFNVSAEAAKVSDFDFLLRAGKAFEIYHIDEVLSNFRLRPWVLNGKAWEKEYELMKDVYIISRRYGGRRFGGHFFKYCVCLAIDCLRPILRPFYPFIERMANKYKFEKMGSWNKSRKQKESLRH